MNKKLSIKNNKMVVFEGLDQAGKSTQINRFQAIPWGDVPPKFVHMPSGLMPTTMDIYENLERGGFSSPLATQLFHLACHAENVPTLMVLKQEGAIILDRFWWSTVAYGWYGGKLAETGLQTESFMNVIDTVWSELRPDLVFLFLNAHRDDSSNNDGVVAGYLALAERFSQHTVLVPELDVEDTTSFIADELFRAGIAS
ncbi:dTMP kinase [Paeniglutamicibacter gangotriensis]|uniref:dTMP kinase n=1 Tax=Paeniglutamicibacter gangotriensis TaxID=254787 RepID=UPI0037C7DC3E